MRSSECTRPHLSLVPGTVQMLGAPSVSLFPFPGASPGLPLPPQSVSALFLPLLLAHHHGNQARLLPVGLGLSGRWKSACSPLVCLCMAGAGQCCSGVRCGVVLVPGTGGLGSDGQMWSPGIGTLLWVYVVPLGYGLLARAFRINVMCAVCRNHDFPV